MDSISRREALRRLSAATGIMALGRPHTVRASRMQDLNARIVAVGIPDASAVSPVGTFLTGSPCGSPIPTKFPAFIQPGAVLDPRRILVGARSNFGAPLASDVGQPGALLSIDPSGPDILRVPPTFASDGHQASALGGRVQMYSANSPFCPNSVHNPSAVTAGYTGVSNPLGLSINNAFGRIWPANAPFGQSGVGSSSILDPDGLPLNGAPNPLIGGVYVGALTNRNHVTTPSEPQVVPGMLSAGAVGTAFLGPSPDHSCRAVFCVVTADGAMVQEHTVKGLDGLAPVETVQALLGRRWDPPHQGLEPRLGVIVNYSPVPTLFVSEPFNDTIAVIELMVTGPAGNEIFAPRAVSTIRSDALHQPVDLAPAELETDDPHWASNTTLEEDADFYVANRGDNTIVRMRQDGTVVAMGRVRLAQGQALGNGRLNGIATSPDGMTIWVTVAGQLAGQGNLEGAVLELPAFAA
jgi:hypothetical protein